MKRKSVFLLACLVLVHVFLSPVTVLSSDQEPSGQEASAAQSSSNKYLNIATNDARPLSVDRMLYVALNDIGYQTALINTSIRTGYAITNNGEADGVIAYDADLGDDYPNLVKVPAEIAKTNVYAVIPEGAPEINGWSGLAGLRVGVLDENLYIISKIPYEAQIVTLETNAAILGELQSGRLDAAVISVLESETVNLPGGVAYSSLLDSQNNYLFLNKKHEGLVLAVSKSLERMTADGRAQKILDDIGVPELSAKKTVLHIISSGGEIAREEQFTETLRKQFENDMSIDWYNVTLDFRRFSRDPNRLVYISNRIRQDCVSRNISAIVVSGDVALEFIRDHYNLYFRNVPVLFYGVDEGYKEVIAGYERNFTGILENIEAYETVEAGLKLFPDTKNLYVLNDFTAEGARYRKTIEEQLKPYADVLNIEYNDNTALETILEYIKALPEDSLVFVGSYFSDVDRQFYHLNEMKRLLEINCSVPILSFHSTRPEYDAIGGKCLDYGSFGAVIADMLESVLSGAVVSDIPAVTDSRELNRWVFDRILLDTFNISESALPPQSSIANSIPSIWESNPKFAVTLIFLFFVGIGSLGVISRSMYKRRKRKEQKISDMKVRAVKERLERIIGTAPISFLISVDGVITDINDNMRNETGLDIGDSSIEMYAAKEEREALIERVIQEGIVKNEILRFNFSDGSVHRCNISFATIDYDGKVAIVAWMVDIEQSEMQKDQLHTASHNLQAILDRMPVAVRITENETGSVAYANDACLNLFGYPSFESLRGRLITELAPPVQANGEYTRDIIKKMLYSETSVSFELDYFHTDGSLVQARVISCNIDYNGVNSTIAIITDLAEEKKSQKIRDTLQMILDFLPIPIRIADLESSALTYTNKAGAELFRVPSPEAVYGVPMFKFMPERQSDGERTVDKVKRVSESDELRTTDFTCIRADGEQFEARISVCIIDYNGKKSSLGTIIDLTAEKEYQRKLLVTAEKEREANQLKSRFLVNMSHEIRTPMNVIIGLTEIELHKSITNHEKEVYKKISMSAKNLLEIINDILDLSKIEADKMKLYDDEFELEEVVNSAMLVASPRLDGKNVEFMLNISLTLPRFIIGDRTRLWQILKNFLDNSAKYTEEGKISLSIFEDTAHSDSEFVSIIFIVEDSGIGIDEEQMKRIFQPYEQIYNDAQRKYTGTGLGLAISKQLCELMGGNMSLKSNVGQGTTIRLNIPFKRSGNNETASQMMKAPSLAGTRVLAVDDSKLSLEIMERLLKSNDAICTTAQSGAEAIDILIERTDSGESFDIILLDYMMDGMNGLETARQIHLAMSKAPKLLMVTAYQKLLLKSELEKNGIDDILEKPFIPSQFINKLCTVLNYDLINDKSEAMSYITYKDAHVLLCEDYPINQEVAVGMFLQFGVTTTVAEDGKQGLERLYSGEKFDLIFMDLKMPVMDGYEATRIIRANKDFDDIPIISLTADAMKEIVDKCLEIGMNDHVAKPIEFDSLDRVFKKWLPESKRLDSKASSWALASSASDVLARFGGNRERYEKALLDFSGMLPDKWPDFADAMSDSEKTAFNIHKLKGAAGNLNENEIFNCAADFERTMRALEPDELMYNHFVEVCAAAKKRIREKLVGTEAMPLAEGTPEELRELLAELSEALKEYDPKASGVVIKSLKAKTWPHADTEKLGTLMELSQKYEFEAALDVITSITEAN